MKKKILAIVIVLVTCLGIIFTVCMNIKLKEKKISLQASVNQYTIKGGKDIYYIGRINSMMFKYENLRVEFSLSGVDGNITKILCTRDDGKRIAKEVDNEGIVSINLGKVIDNDSWKIEILCDTETTGKVSVSYYGIETLGERLFRNGRVDGD